MSLPSLSLPTSPPSPCLQTQQDLSRKIPERIKENWRPSIHVADTGSWLPIIHAPLFPDSQNPNFVQGCNVPGWKTTSQPSLPLWIIMWPHSGQWGRSESYSWEVRGKPFSKGTSQSTYTFGPLPRALFLPWMQKMTHLVEQSPGQTSDKPEDKTHMLRLVECRWLVGSESLRCSTGCLPRISCLWQKATPHLPELIFSKFSATSSQRQPQLYSSPPTAHIHMLTFAPFPSRPFSV